MEYTLDAQDGKAKAGTLKTAHGDIQTPIFMPVGTRGTVKSIWQHELKEINAQIILGNTYHLYLRPGDELVARMRGLHQFMQWDRPILTDSGGFQVFSLNDLNKISEEGVEFRSHLDGSKHMLSPEKSMAIQKNLGSDIVMCFDECPALPASRERLRESMELSLRWAKRCRDFELSPHQNLFGIIQGGLELDLRTECLERLEEMDFPGLAIGGLSVGEKNDEMRSLLEEFTPQMPLNKPRYLMGVGKPTDILHAIKAGVEMFDCVLPTRNARNGQFLTHQGPLNIKKERFKEDELPPDPECNCKVCQTYSRSYIRHLYVSGEYLAGQMISYHNLHFYLELTKGARQAIIEGTYNEFYAQRLSLYESGEWLS